MLAHTMTKIAEVNRFFNALDEMSCLHAVAGSQAQIFHVLGNPTQYKKQVQLCETYDFIKRGTSIRPEFLEQCIEDIAESICLCSIDSEFADSDDLWTKWEKNNMYLPTYV